MVGRVVPAAARPVQSRHFAKFLDIHESSTIRRAIGSAGVM